MTLFVPRLSLCVALLGSLLGACSSDGDDQAACNTLVDDAPTLTGVAVAQAAPAAVGGTIADGSYELSGFTLYTGPGGQSGTVPVSISAVIEITGDVMQQVGSIDGDERRYTSTFTTSGNVVSTSDTCPAPDTAMHEFTATPAEILIYDQRTDPPAGTLQQRYTRR